MKKQKLRVLVICERELQDCSTRFSRRWPSTSAWQSGLRSRSSLPIRTARGSAAPTRTPMACCASACRRAGLVGVYAAGAECHCPSPEHAPEKMSRLCYTAGSLYATTSSTTRCTWNLNPPSLTNAHPISCRRKKCLTIYSITPDCPTRVGGGQQGAGGAFFADPSRTPQ